MIKNWLLVSGVRVIPELDTPGHVGYGWQFPGSENFTVCVGQDPWMGYCPQPPCGQVRLCCFYCCYSAGDNVVSFLVVFVDVLFVAFFHLGV
jgi:hypothetical protein